MTKSECVENLRSYDAAVGKMGVVLSAVILMVFGLYALSIWLIRHEYLGISDLWLTGFFGAFMVGWACYSTYCANQNEVKYKLRCPKCGESYNDRSLTVAMLENRCQTCGREIYVPE